MYRAIGAAPSPPPTACPPCSFLQAGTCVWCPDLSPGIPGCENCVGHHLPPPPAAPWYRAAWVAPTAVGVGTAVITTVVTAVVMTKLRPRIDKL